MRKETRTYYFSVEGKTEKWYLEWLQNTINNNSSSKEKVKFRVKVDREPVSYVKGLSIIDETEIIHVCDYESNEENYEQSFRDTLKKMKEAEKIGKTVVYRLGYSNFTFELWMILHKMDCAGSKSHRNDYCELINKAYQKDFEALAQFKNEDEFKRILRQLTLENVYDAIRRAKKIMEQKKNDNCTLKEYKGYEYYRDNPALSLGEIIGEILEECGLMKLN